MPSRGDNSRNNNLGRATKTTLPLFSADVLLAGSSVAVRMSQPISIFTKVIGLSSRIAIFPFALLLFVSAQASSAQTIWADGSGDWFNPTNWSAGVPSSSIEAQIHNGGTAQVNLEGAVAANLYLGFEGDAGHVVVSGAGTLESGVFTVGHLGSGTVTVQNGGTLSDGLGYIGIVPGSTGSAIVDGPGSTWTTELYLNVGYSGTGTLTIRNGGVVSDRLGFVGSHSGSSGVVSVEGAGSRWSSIGQIQIGREGTGDLTIRNGGAVDDLIGYIGASGGGTVLVDGAGSKWTNRDWVVVGEGSSGTLTIQNAGAVSAVYGFIGRLSGSAGTVLVDGPDSIWTNSASLEIAQFGTGSLTIRNGGAVLSVFSTSIGGYAGSHGEVVVDGLGSRLITQVVGVDKGALTIQKGGTVSSNGGLINGAVLIDGIGSSWAVSSQFEVGFSGGNGILTIQNGGTLFSGSASLGNFSRKGSGTVLVDGPGSSWHTHGLKVGVSDPGTLNIFHGGIVSSFFVGVGVGEGSTGRVAVDGTGSALNVSTNLYVGGGDIGDGARPGGTGLLDIANDGKISATTTTIFRRGTIINNALLVSENVSITPGGLLAGNGSVLGNVSNAGRTKPGGSIGQLTIDGHYAQSSDGTLEIEVTGTNPDASDHLDITGNATVDGTLEVRFVNGFLPLSGQVFKLMNVGGAFSGSFSQFIFPNLRPGFQFTAEFVNGTYQITALNDGVAATGFLNISTRLRVGTGDNTLIAGFIVTGNAAKKVIIRAIGPSLAMHETSSTGLLADPTLELRDSTGALIFSNDNWMESPQKQEIVDSGIPPSDEHEAAIVATLAPGRYTALMRGVDRTTGLGVVEVYDLAQEVSASLSNVSSRGFVEIGDNVMIGGFIADNQAAEVIVRALGPSLTQFGIPNALADPTLELYNTDGAIIAYNNDWQDDDPAAITATGIPPSNGKESAILTTLAPGNYTAIIRGQNDTTGVGLVEVYDLP